MSSKKSGQGKGRSPALIKKDLRRLKDKGLYSGDLRKKPTRYAIGQIKKFNDVLSGKTKVVAAPTRSAAREYKTSFKVKGDKIVVPVQKGDKVTYSKRSGELVTRRRAYGRKLRVVHPKKLRSIRDLDNLPQGPDITYRMPIGLGGAMETLTYQEVKKFYNEYAKRRDRSGKHSMEFLRAYLEIVYDEDYEGSADLSDEDLDYEDIYGDEE